ncbi:mannose-6-phosphate isomerase [Bacteriovorax stolpii]|nr:type I phosphomannose isomerase catalytic subunit [Bacteriovorax stolpii]TDP53336.1 mannose-6-phosphate isomerase [Bacteriovorax stolpii]
MIYYLTPSAHRTIWGGQHLESLKNLPVSRGADPYGETWEISVHPQGPSFCQGKKLEVSSHAELPYLVKILDTSKNLSVQVHPDDEYARVHENSSGKAECYVIIACERNAILYLGMKPGVTRESFLKGLENKKNMSEYMNAFEVKPGDFFFTPPGSIHAIGAGITMAEVQQSSGITYRVWDWDRLDSEGKPRQLHVEKSLDVINFDPSANTKEFFKFTENIFNHNGAKVLAEHPDFKLTLVNLKKGQKISLPLSQSKRLPSILNLQGKLSVNNHLVEAYNSVLLKGETELNVVGVDGTSFLFIQ